MKAARVSLGRVKVRVRILTRPNSFVVELAADPRIRGEGSTVEEAAVGLRLAWWRWRLSGGPSE